MRPPLVRSLLRRSRWSLPSLHGVWQGLFGLLLFGAGWLLIAQQHALLWQRLPPGTIERFVADRIAAPLPKPMPVAELRRLCAEPPSPVARLWPAQNRREIASCLGRPDFSAADEVAAPALAAYQAIMDSQVAAAQAWLRTYDAEAERHRAELSAALARLQHGEQNDGLLARLQHRLGPAAESPREPVGPQMAPDEVATHLRTRLATTLTRLQALQADARPLAQRARELGLAAAGLRLDTDYGDEPAASHLVTDRQTLADALEWRRRGQEFAAQGFTLERLHGIGSMLLASAIALMAVVALTGGSLPLWALATQLVGFGALLLSDVALTGDPALRYLAERQFVMLGVAGHWLGLAWTSPWALFGAPLRLWWPFLATAGTLLVLSLLRDGEGRLTAPLRHWVKWGASPWRGAAQAALLWLAAAVAVVALGLPAAVSEWLILLGCLGVATYAARQAAYANTRAGLQWPGLVIVAGALSAAVGLALQRGDLGHALVALLMAACFFWLFGNPWLRWGLAALGLAIFAMLVASLQAGHPAGPMALLVDGLPAHAQDRFQAMFDPFHADSSDLARARWLMASAGNGGWGLGYVPWQGLIEAHSQDGLPLQGPSDYVLALASASWGRAGGLAMLGAVLALFIGAAIVAARKALGSGMPVASRFAAAVGLFGCTVMAAKVVLSVAGVLGLLPLTGLPVALLGYGPVSLLAALFYLALALGTRGTVPAASGVNLQPAAVSRGAVRRRGLALACVATALAGVLLAAGLWRLGSGRDAAVTAHVSQDRLALARDVAAALITAGGAPSSDEADAGAPPSCPQIATVARAWNLRLQQAPHPALRLDLARLLAGRPVDSRERCKVLARSLGRLLDDDFQRILGRRPAPSAQAAGLAAPRPQAQPRDYTTADAWWGVPGCALPVASAAYSSSGAASAPTGATATRAAGASAAAMSAIAATVSAPASAATATATAEAAASPLAGCGSLSDLSSQDLALDAIAADPWLQQELGPRLQAALRTPVGEQMLNHHRVAAGPSIGLTLDTGLQALSQRIADCFTARRAAADCAEALPTDAGARRQHFGPEGLRAGAIGLVLAEVDSGRIVALAGSVSDCSVDALQRPATAAANGAMPALRGQAPCAQLPDQRSAYLLTQHPASWMVGPGSSLKPLAAIAGVDSHLIAPKDDAAWKRILAESHEQAPIQAIALGAGMRYLDTLSGAGFTAAPSELLWGGEATADAKTPFAVRWRIPTRAGHEELQAAAMPFETMQQLRREKEAGVNIDKLHGRKTVEAYLAARRLADASVGGADLRISALGLVDVWRRIDLQARGEASARALHLLEQPGRPVLERPLALGSAEAAARVIGMTTGITSSAWHGTAQGSCRVVFGGCPEQGLAGLAGKTGTADFLVAEDSPWVKDGLQLPAKLFGGVFSIDGKRYAIAAMALRVREGRSRSLELSSSAAAETALTLMRQLGAKPPALTNLPAARPAGHIPHPLSKEHA